MDDPPRFRAAGRRAALRASLAAPAAWLAGCSPELDWREIRAEDAACWVMLPAKPARLTRPIHLEGLKVDMTMVGAQVRDVAYTVGTIRLPDAAAATRERALAAMRTAMVRNIDGAERGAREVPIDRIDPGGTRTGAVTGVEVVATGRMRGAEATMIARFAGEGARVWQAVVLGTAIDRDAAATFLGSLKLLA